MLRFSDKLKIVSNILKHALKDCRQFVKFVIVNQFTNCVLGNNFRKQNIAKYQKQTLI